MTVIPNGSERIRTIICQSNEFSQVCPPDPQIIRGVTSADPPFGLTCGNDSTEIPASQYTR